MDIREVDRGDDGALHRFWEVGRLAETATRPYDFYSPWEGARSAYRHGRAGFRNELLGAFEDGLMVGRGYLVYPVLDNTHLAFGEVHVDPRHQGRGVGTALLAAVEERARREGRRTLVVEAYSPLAEDGPSLRFGRKRGYVPAIEDAMKVVDLVRTEPTWPALEQEVSARCAGYTLVGWLDEVPDEHLTGYCRLNEAFNEEAPSGDLELEPEVWDEERVRTRAEQNRAGGRREAAVAALAPDGTMVGLTEIALSRYAPQRGFQSGTLVLPEHRGHALGLAMKLRNHRVVREHFPECRVLMTGNAGVNVAMNAVNERLGYRDVERCVELQKQL